MDIYTFISNIISSLSWPLALVLLIVLLRKEIRSLIPSLQSVKYKEFEMAFDQKAKELEKHAKEIALKQSDNELLPSLSANDTITELIGVSPRLAVIETFTWLESAIRDATIRHRIGKDQFYGVRNGFRVLVKQGIIPEKYMKLFNEFRMLRNELSHNMEAKISSEASRIYAEKAFALTEFIKKA